MQVPFAGKNFYDETRINIDKYVHPDDREFAHNLYCKETMQLKALNTEKELARRDELTGVKNKTAYNELLSRQALFMLFLPSMLDTTLQTSR